MGVIILGANTSNIKFCLFKKIPMASKGLNPFFLNCNTSIISHFAKIQDFDMDFYKRKELF